MARPRNGQKRSELWHRKGYYITVRFMNKSKDVKMCINAECKNRTEFLQTVPRCQPVDCNGTKIPSV